MKSVLTFLMGGLALIIGCANSFAQTSKTNSNSLLWRISGNKLTKPSYLFGTMHLICPGDYVWTENMNRSFNVSEKICFEMDMDDPDVLTEITTGLIDKSGKKLEDYFTAEQYKTVKKYVKDSFGVDIAIFQHMKPVVLQTMMTVNSAICPNPVSYEDSLMRIAHKSKKEILGLEKPIEQIEVLESIPTDSVIQGLLAMIDHKDNSDDSDYAKLIAAYTTQDIPMLYKLITASKDLGDMGVFLDGRNKKWIPRMADKMRSSSVFFAVGAGHLGGETGVIALLRKEGYTVIPLN